MKIILNHLSFKTYIKIIYIYILINEVLENTRDIYDLSAHGMIIENNSSGYDIGNRYFITYCPYGDGVTFEGIENHLKFTKEDIISILTDYEIKKTTQDLQELILNVNNNKFQININYGKFIKIWNLILD